MDRQPFAPLGTLFGAYADTVPEFAWSSATQAQLHTSRSNMTGRRVLWGSDGPVVLSLHEASATGREGRTWKAGASGATG